MELDLYHQYAEVEKLHWWFSSRRAIIHQFIMQLGLPQPAKILEIGCGTGGNIDMLSEFGELTVMDLSQEVIDVVREKFNISALLGSFPEQVNLLKGRQFDLIVMLDVLEHIHDDQYALQVMRTLLKPRGKILLTVPAYQWLWSGHDVLDQHYRRYLKTPLVKLLRKAGYRIQHATYFNAFLFPAVVSVRLWHNLFHTAHVDEDLVIPAPWMNTSLRRIFGLERYLLRYSALPFGGSILLTAEIS